MGDNIEIYDKKGGFIMHEMSYCVRIVDEAIKAAVDNDIKEVSGVYVEVGEMTACVNELLIKAFNKAKLNTCLENATLHLTNQEVIAFCEDCQKEFKPSRENNYSCPICKGIHSHIVKGRDCVILKIEGE